MADHAEVAEVEADAGLRVAPPPTEQPPTPLAIEVLDADSEDLAELTVVAVEPAPLPAPVAVVLLDAPPAGGDTVRHLDLDDLRDVDAPPAAVGVLTRSEPRGRAALVPLPAPPPRPQRHTQAVAALRWQVAHGLGYRPLFDVHDSEGRPHRPEDVEHPIPGEVSEIVFGVPMSGTADPS